jgi:hypothetical protein
MTSVAGILPNVSPTPQPSWQLRDVAAIACQGVGTFGLGVFSEVFGFDRTADGLPRFDYAVVAGESGRCAPTPGCRSCPSMDSTV